MKKICYITTIPGTIRTFILDLARYLKREKKYDITFICDYDADFARSISGEFNYIPVKMSRGIDLNCMKTILQLRRIFKKQHFDYIQYSTPNASFYSAVALWGINDAVKLYAQWGIRYVGAPGFGRLILKQFEKITCRLTPNVRAVSKKNMAFGIKEKLYSVDKVKVIGNGGTIGVDMSVFDISRKDEFNKQIRNEYKIKDDCFVFGFIGRASRDKGINELLAAYKHLHDMGYNSKLILVGTFEYSGELRAELLSWAEECNDVIIAGRFPREEVPKFYAAFDCYVHPTYREGFGMVLQEAGAMGNAIITTDIPGASEVMEKDISCKIVSPRNSGELMAEMEYMIKNRTAAESIGQAAYARTKKLYERSVMIHNIVQDIEALLGE